MSATYSGDPRSSKRDAVRFLCRDTTTGAMLLQDEELDWLLLQAGDSVYAAAAEGCDLLMERYLQSKTVGDTTVEFNTEALTRLAAQYRQRSQRAGLPSVASVAASADDMYFRLDMHDNPDLG